MKLAATALLCGKLLCVTALRAQAPHITLDDPAVITRGAALFASSCAVGYCHGAEGRAGGGPRLAGRKLDQDYLFKTISMGINQSPMPAFKSELSSDQIWSVVAYISSLSEPAAGHVARAGRETALPPAAANPPVERTRSNTADPNGGDVEAGGSLFFDLSNPRHCALCHQFQGRGINIAPDLTSLTAKLPKDILRDILEPDVSLAIEPVTVVTKSGERITGIKKQEERDRIRIYDTGSLPPVLRTIYRDQLQTVTAERRSPMPHDYGQTLTPKQLLHLISFLKSASVTRQQLE
jgi:putative heme-binding domain-containing protein